MPTAAENLKNDLKDDSYEKLVHTKHKSNWVQVMKSDDLGKDELWYQLEHGKRPFCYRCQKRLVPVGHWREGGANHDDWASRHFHKGCITEQTKYGR
jgi:hypothetical protein